MNEHAYCKGEYKTPGGKLVGVRFRVENSMLRDVEVFGDFFLYPDDVLPLITASLEGAPADLDDTAYATRIDAAIPDGTEWLGSSPEGLAIAVRRALEAGPVYD